MRRVPSSPRRVATALATTALVVAACGGRSAPAPAAAPVPVPPPAAAPSAESPPPAAPAPVVAPSAAPARPRVDPMAAPLAEARELAGRGDVASARVLVDSLLSATLPGSDAEAEGLYWRATFAESAEEAERDYARLVRDHPLSPRAADASMRLAQLELMRNRPAEARRHLDRVLRDGAGDAQAQAGARYWMARAQLVERDTRGACLSLAHADAAAAPGSELARQVVALEPRIEGCRVATVRASLPTPVPGVARASVATPPATAPASAPASAPPRVAQSAPPPPATRPATSPSDSARVAPSRAAAAAPPTSTATRPASPSPAPPPTRQAAESASRAAPPAATTGRYTVQLAAYDTRGGAEGFVARLRRDGYDARVYAQGAAGDRPPFRVRVGRFATRAEASAQLAALKRRGHEGFVAETEPAGGAR